MASMHQTGPEDRKASSLTEAPSAPIKPTMAVDGGKSGGGLRAKRRDMSRVRVLILDIVLLVVLVGLVVGGYFGYRTLRRLYAPTWDARDVVFCVEMENIDLDMVKYNQDGRPSLTGCDLWSSDRTDADRLGRVTDVRTVLVTHEDGSSTLTLYLTVEATADYLEGYGYRMGATMLLAGTESTYRLPGLSAEGTIISLHEADETDAEADDDLIISDGHAPAGGE